MKLYWNKIQSSENEGDENGGIVLVGRQEKKGKPKQHQKDKPHIPLERGPSKDSCQVDFSPSRKNTYCKQK